MLKISLRSGTRCSRRQAIFHCRGSCEAKAVVQSQSQVSSTKISDSFWASLSSRENSVSPFQPIVCVCVRACLSELAEFPSKSCKYGAERDREVWEKRHGCSRGGQQLGRDPSTTGSCNFLILKSFCEDGTFWASSLHVSPTLSKI